MIVAIWRSLHSNVAKTSPTGQDSERYELQDSLLFCYQDSTDNPRGSPSDHED